MKLKIRISLMALLMGIGSLFAQDVTTVEATSSDISDNLDLEAVASIFGEAENLEDFENKLNDPKTQISNLDLNEDGEVDYLRVVENSKDDTHLVSIQAVIGEDQFQDVATIEVEKDSKGETQVQVVGDVYMYGPDYIIEPVYVHPPVVVVWFWGPYYHPWRSPYYYGYYPPYYHPWHPYPAPRYHSNVHVHINVNNSYHRTTVRRSSTSVELHNKNRQNAYASKHPNNSFAKRNEGVKNKQELNQKRGSTKTSNAKTKNTRTQTGKKVQSDWKPASEKSGNKSKVNNNRVSVPSERKNTKPTNNNAKAKGQPAKQKTTTKPASKSTTKPANKATSRPAAKPAKTNRSKGKRK